MVNLWEPKYSNCIVWGVYAKIKYGAKWEIIASNTWNVKGGNWHLICRFKNGEVRSYVPVDKEPVNTWWEVIKTTLFEGKVINGAGARNRKTPE